MERLGLGEKGSYILILSLALTLVGSSPGRAEDVKAKETQGVQPGEAKPEEIKEIKPEEVKEVQLPEKPQWTLGTDILTQYVFRGIALSRGSAVLQPSYTGSYKGFTFNAWFNFDTSEKNPFSIKRPNSHQFRWNETDLTFSYSREVVKNLTLTGGLIYYILDGANSPFDQLEVYAGFGYKLPWFEVGFAAFREVGHFPGTYLQWYVSRSLDLPLWGASLDLWASWGAEISNDKAAFPIPGKPNQFYQSLHAGHVMATLNFPLGKYVKISPKVMYWYALGGDATKVIAGASWDGKHNHVLGGATISVTF